MKNKKVSSKQSTIKTVIIIVSIVALFGIISLNCKDDIIWNVIGISTLIGIVILAKKYDDCKKMYEQVSVKQFIEKIDKNKIITFILIVLAACIVSKIFINISQITWFDKVEIKNTDNINISKDFKEILYNCELKDAKVTRDESLDTLYGEGSIGYRIVKDGINTVMYLKDGKVLCVKYADKYLYNNGEYFDKLSNYIITEQEKSNLVYKCENAVSGILKSPSTATYPWNYDEWKMNKDNGVIVVQSYVDAQNLFGVKSRSKFQLTIKDNTITSLIFDGKEYMK